MKISFPIKTFFIITYLSSTLFSMQRTLLNVDVLQALNTKKNLYAILEVNPTATQEEIKKKYRRLALIHHPDRGGNPEKFKDLTLANTVLQDVQLRAEYDRELAKQFTQPIIQGSFGYLVERKILPSQVPADGILNATAKNITSLNGLENLQGIERLKVLILNNNMITTLPENIFDRMVNLEELSLASNQLQEFPATILVHKLPKLRLLNLRGNNELIESIFGVDSKLYEHENLRNLVRSLKNKFYPQQDNPGSTGYFFIVPPRYAEGSVGYVLEKEHIPFQVPNTGILDLKGKKLTSLAGLQDIKGLEKLRILDLGANKLEVLPIEAFNNMTQLEELSLFGNPSLKEFPVELLTEKLPNLKKLNLVFNKKLRDIDIEPKGYDAKSLVELKERLLRQSYQRSSSARQSPELKRAKTYPNRSVGALLQIKPNLIKIDSNGTLDLSDENLTSLQGLQEIDNLEQVRVLHLGRNSLEKFALDAGVHLKNVEQLFLDFNHLKELPKNIFETFPKLKILDLTGNNDLSAIDIIPQRYEGETLQSLKMVLPIL